jgi:hypothetical protein
MNIFTPSILQTIGRILKFNRTEYIVPSGLRLKRNFYDQSLYQIYGMTNKM